MDIGRLLVTFAVLGATGMCADTGKQPDPKKAPVPKISSVFPMSGQRGCTFEILVRGSGLAGARALMFEGTGLNATVLSLTAEPPAVGEKIGKDLLKAQVSLPNDTVVGTHYFRVITSFGVSNKLPLDVSSEPVLNEGGAAQALKQFPVVINGRIPKPGDTNSYWIEVLAGETLTFEASAIPGGFDPSITLYEPGGSWFDPHRLNLVASNDEPLSFPGLSTDARLVEH